MLAGASLVACSKPSTEPIAKRSERLVITDGLVAAYDCDEGSGATAPDISGNGNTGTLSGATWNASGRRGSALSFDGIDDRVLVPDSASLDLTSGMTLMAWVKPAPGESDWGTVMLKKREEGLVYGLFSSDSDGRPNAWMRTNGEDASVYGDHHALRTDRWTHVAAAYDGSSFTYYVNGKVENTANVSGAIETSSEVLSIGGNSIWGEWFHGLMDEIRVYGRGLSQNEVTLEMSGLSRGPAPELVAAYNFDDGTGTVAADASGSSNTGALAGPTWSTAGKHGGASRSTAAMTG